MPPARKLGSPLIRMGAVTSTMDIVRQLEAFGAFEGTAVVAAAQSHGRGRSSRTWQSSPGTGLYCSILLRPQIPVSRFQSFSIAAALAICEALDPDRDIGLELKWPNDILYQERKLAGILITSSLSGSIVESAIIGIGLNLHTDSARPEAAISLSEIVGCSNPVLDDVSRSLFDALSHRYSSLCTTETSAIADWTARLAFHNQHVTLHDGQATHTGVIEGLDSSGNLILQTSHGPLITVAGELTRGPQPSLTPKEHLFYT